MQHTLEFWSEIVETESHPESQDGASPRLENLLRPNDCARYYFLNGFEVLTRLEEEEMGEVEVGEGGSKEEEEGSLVEVTRCTQCITRTNADV